MWAFITIGLLLLAGIIYLAIDTPIMLVLFIPMFLAFVGIEVLALVKGKLAYPIYISDDEITYRDEKIKWDDVRITLFPYARHFGGRWHRRDGSRWFYCMVFGDRYLKDDGLRKTYERGFYIKIVNKKDFFFIEEKYKHKFCIVENNGCVQVERLYEFNEFELSVNRKIIEETIYAHNEKYNDLV